MLTALQFAAVQCAHICLQIRSKHDVYTRNEQLLEYICEAGVDQDKFFDALKETDQQHVVNYILQHGRECIVVASNEFHATVLTATVEETKL